MGSPASLSRGGPRIEDRVRLGVGQRVAAAAVGLNARSKAAVIAQPPIDPGTSRQSEHSKAAAIKGLTAAFSSQFIDDSALEANNC